uniref:EF-hand calcium binding domain 14 n=1 Tax=Sarcophilus harrisii TaxID=9305 RepID=A0A7N4NW26_SARHA
MKKRKELNALIGLGPGDGRGRSRRSRRAWRGAAGHRLLRTEPPASGSASSSEDEDEDDEDEDERGGGGGGGSARARFARWEGAPRRGGEGRGRDPQLRRGPRPCAGPRKSGRGWGRGSRDSSSSGKPGALRDRGRGRGPEPASRPGSRSNAFSGKPARPLCKGLSRSLVLAGRADPSSGLPFRGDYFRCCKVCYPLCAFVILAACVVACVGLVWMQVALKEDLDALKDQFRSLESNQKSSFQEIPKLNEELLRKQKQLEKIESGDLGLSKVWINITEMTKQIASLTSTVNHLKANIKSASDLISLPATVEGLQKSVASIGSTLNSVRLAVEAVQKTVDEHKKTIETLQSDLMTDGASSLKKDSHKTDGEQAQILKKEESSVSKLREKLQLITALTSKPEAFKEEKKQSAASEPATFPRISPRSLGNQVEAAKHLKPVIPEISSLADLLDLFQRTGQGPEGKLSYQDLWNLLGSALPSAQSMAEFDVDRDGTYSFPELRLALGIEHMEQN